MRLFRDHLSKISGYVPGIQPKNSDFIKLNTNENPYPPSPRVIKALREALNGSLRLYPDPLSDRLRDRIAEVCALSREWVLVGNGSDEILNWVSRAVLAKGDELWVTDPTYILYEVLAQFQEAKTVRCLLDEKFDLPHRFNLKNAQLIMISNPNTPTGTCFDKSKIIKICSSTRALVLIDEAYVDFAQCDCIELVKNFKNVLVTRSFSKSFSLAGMRIGYAVGRPETIGILMKLKDSYNLNRLSQAAALAALNDMAWMKENVERIIRDRFFLSENLSKLGFHVLPSQANFIFAAHKNFGAKWLYERLYERKFLVRHFELPRLENYLRISIGTHLEMVKLVGLIRELTKGGGKL